MMEVVVTPGATSRAKLQSNHHQQTNIQFFLQARCPSCRPTNSVKALKLTLLIIHHANGYFWIVLKLAVIN